MIKFFRKIRYDLMEKNKTGKYFKYAIGEIFLVMVGILLALQVNNWNQERIAAQKEQLLLNALHFEFIENREQLKEVVSNHKMAMKSTRSVIEFFPIDHTVIDRDILKSKAMKSAYAWTFNPSQGVVKSLVNSSSFELISDVELRTLLVSWEDVLNDYQEEEIVTSQWLRNESIPLLLKHISYGWNFKDKRADPSYISSLEFENFFYQREDDLNQILYNGELKKVQNTIDRVIALSASKDP